MPQQRGMKRAKKVAVRAKKTKVKARAANFRRMDRADEVAAKAEKEGKK